MGVVWIPFEGIREALDGDDEYISEEGLFGHHQEQFLGYLHRGVGWLTVAHPDPRVKLLGAGFYYSAKIPLAIDAWAEGKHQEIYGNSINTTQGGGRTLSQQTESVILPTSSTYQGSGSPRIPSRKLKGDSLMSGGSVRIPR